VLKTNNNIPFPMRSKHIIKALRNLKKKGHKY